MRSQEKILGLDTSNYTTSLAVTNKNGDILEDLRTPLKVKAGDRGLRQSDALFQHLGALPLLLEKAFETIPGHQLAAIAVASKPRPIEGSYMPTFKAGQSFGSALAKALNIPFLEFSHQEGHIEAARQGTALEKKEEFLFYHLSGGTCELLLYSKGEIKEIGGSKDISFGQLFDRIGVALGFSFPCGNALDKIALEFAEKVSETCKLNKLRPIPKDGLFFNLSGIETQGARCLQSLKGDEKDEGEKEIILELFQKTVDCLIDITSKAVEETGINAILFGGGVSSSEFIRRGLQIALKNKRLKTVEIDLNFSKPSLATDNGVGIALLGGKALWR